MMSPCNLVPRTFSLRFWAGRREEVMERVWLPLKSIVVWNYIPLYTVKRFKFLVSGERLYIKCYGNIVQIETVENRRWYQPLPELWRLLDNKKVTSPPNTFKLTTPLATPAPFTAKQLYWPAVSRWLTYEMLRIPYSSTVNTRGTSTSTIFNVFDAPCVTFIVTPEWVTYHVTVGLGKPEAVHGSRTADWVRARSTTRNIATF